jgi:hypothetical protein
MSVIEPIKTFIRDFYNVTYFKINSIHDNSPVIVFHDVYDNLTSDYIKIGSVFGVKVILYWDKIHTITGIDYRHKDYHEHLIPFFREVVAHDKTLDFLRLLVYEELPVTFGLSEVIDEFPVLKD